ncbi:MAG: peptidoglycan-binding protein, partial [Rhizobiaceae bacterium]|nr:peptidoglycan-binding protein [Rhizobiaceae bacterium]
MTGALLAATTTTAPVLPERFAYVGAAQALDFKKLANKAKKDFGKAAKTLKRKDVQRNMALAVAVPLIAGGALSGEVAPIIVGTVLLGATQTFKLDMQKRYASDWGWSGCVQCNKSRIVVPPGRKVSAEQRKRVSETVAAEVKETQTALAELGFYSKAIDGDFGPGTRAGVKAYQASINEPETGALTARQRAMLLATAAGGTLAAMHFREQSAAYQQGEPSAGTGLIETGVTTTPSIAEYDLANSQLQRFAQEYLSGPLSEVASAVLLSDGQVQLRMTSGDKPDIVTGIESVSLEAHALSDQWIRVLHTDPVSGAKTVLNVNDGFASASDAAAWKDAASGRVTLLAKLTERPAATPQTIVAEAPSAAEQAEPSVVAAAPGTAAEAVAPAGVSSESVAEAVEVAVTTAEPTVAPAAAPAATSASGPTLEIAAVPETVAAEAPAVVAAGPQAQPAEALSAELPDTPATPAAQIASGAPVLTPA